MMSTTIRRLFLRQPTSLKYFSTVQASSGEPVMLSILKERFPKAEYVEVRDISGGCGSMYEIYVETSEFQGLSTVKQHRLVTEALKAQIKEMHGLRIHTRLPGSRPAE